MTCQCIEMVHHEDGRISYLEEEMCGPCVGRAFAAGLLGVCWAMAADTIRHVRDPLYWVRRERWSLVAEDRWFHGDALRWLFDQARPPGCRAPWEVT